MTDVSASDAVLELRRALDAVAAALVVADADALYAVQPRVSSALVAIQRVRAVPDDQQAAVRSEVIRCRTVLDQCRRLGALATDLSAAALMATGGAVGYGPVGRTATSGLRGAHVEARR
jgi:hypothetical protein